MGCSGADKTPDGQSIGFKVDTGIPRVSHLLLKLGTHGFRASVGVN